MTLFVAIFGGLLLAAVGLAIGALWGRPLRGGSCGQAYFAAGLLPRCADCPNRDAAAPRTETP